MIQCSIPQGIEKNFAQCEFWLFGICHAHMMTAKPLKAPMHLYFSIYHVFFRKKTFAFVAYIYTRFKEIFTRFSELDAYVSSRMFSSHANLIFLELLFKWLLSKNATSSFLDHYFQSIFDWKCVLYLNRVRRISAPCSNICFICDL